MRFPYRIAIRREAARPLFVAPGWFNLGAKVPTAIIAAVAATSLSGAPAALANTSGSTLAQFTVAIRSMTVAPGVTTFDDCSVAGVPTGSVLSFPNGFCQTTATANRITITNGPLAGHIDVAGSDAIPSDAGTHWTLCGGAGAACNGPLLAPGSNQFDETGTNVNVAATSGPSLMTTAQCDTAFAASCAAAANQAATEALTFTGPTASTDNSQNFNTTWTWTAVP